MTCVSPALRDVNQALLPPVLQTAEKISVAGCMSNYRELFVPKI